MNETINRLLKTPIFVECIYTLIVNMAEDELVNNWKVKKILNKEKLTRIGNIIFEN